MKIYEAEMPCIAQITISQPSRIPASVLVARRTLISTQFRWQTHKLSPTSSLNVVNELRREKGNIFQKESSNGTWE
jgi:hypothetical protein